VVLLGWLGRLLLAFRSGVARPALSRRWLLAPGLAGVLALLVLAEVPLRVSFHCHRPALEALAAEALAAPGGKLTYREPRWVGLFPVAEVQSNPGTGSGFTTARYNHSFRDIYTGFVFRGEAAGEAFVRLDDDWQAYRYVAGKHLRP
jgi:hypothetical protein